MNYLWIRHPKKRIRHQFLARLIFLLGEFIYIIGGFIFLYGGFIYFLGGLTIGNESAMTCTWIRPKMKWIQHQIYISTTLFHESASFISREFKVKAAWLLEIVGEFIFWWENNTLFRCVLVLLSTDILFCGVVSGCALCCVVLFSVVLSALSGLVVLPLPQMFRTTTYHLLRTLYLDIVLLL